MSSVKKQIINGVMWSGIQKYSGMAVSLIVSAILARLLSPAEFGVVAIANVLIWFFSMFATMGIGPAIIQRKDLCPKDLDDIFTFTFVIGVFLACLFFACSWIIADFYNNDQLVIICQLLAFTLFLSAINMVPGALMSKNLKFKEMALRTLALQIITGVMSVVAAYKGAGIYALLISPLLTPIGTFFYNRMFFPVHLSLKFSFKPIKKIFSFSVYQFLFEFSNYLSRNLDKLIIGRSVSICELGYYEKSYRLMQLPLQNITFVITPVLQPILSKFEDNKNQIANKNNKLVGILASISFPLTVILYGCSEELIHLFYGSNWDKAIPVFRILSISVAFQMLLSTTGAIFQSCNNTKAQFWVGMRNTLTTVIGFVIVAIYYKTIIAMAYAWVITLIINFVCSYYILYKTVLKSSLWGFAKLFILPICNALILCILLFVLEYLLCSMNEILSLIIKSMVLIFVALFFVQLVGQYDIYHKIKEII